MLVNELIDNLGRQVNPDVENTVLTLLFEGFKEILLYIADDGVCTTKVQLVPLAV